jgi:hypothetical protein
VLDTRSRPPHHYWSHNIVVAAKKRRWGPVNYRPREGRWVVEDASTRVYEFEPELGLLLFGTLAPVEL